MCNLSNVIAEAQGLEVSSDEEEDDEEEEEAMEQGEVSSAVMISWLEYRAKS